MVKRINKGESWKEIFPGVATLTITPEGDGPGIALRITKKEGEAVRLVPEGTPDANSLIAVKRVNELDFYTLGLKDLAKKLKKGEARLLWYIRSEKMQEDPEYFKEIRIGKSTHKRYSKKCYEKLQASLMEIDLDQRWANRKAA